jgi:diaminohydroxyphosphoribosylaminopyrimidine deaminase/5-amino-6-(5-phosphoribosylamino)uracil reductase
MNSSQAYLEMALAAAQLKRGFCAPNPSVGAVIVNREGAVIATGHHNGPGTAHAEINALQQITNVTDDMTLYVTLEPCCHYGRTPPCTEAIIQSGLKRVIFAYQDPNPMVAGKGALRLNAAGIKCEHLPLPSTNAFYQSYARWHRLGLPFVTAKLAMTMNGKIAGQQGERIQITGQELQIVTHQYRKQADALLTSAKTVQADNPLFNVRLSDETWTKPLYVLDRTLCIDPTANVFSSAKSVVLLHAPSVTPAKIQAFTARGIRCVSINEDQARLNLSEVLHVVGQDGVHDLWIEAGGVLTSQFIQEDLLQRCLLYVAPTWLEHGLDALLFDVEQKFGTANFCWQKYGDDFVADILF